MEERCPQIIRPEYAIEQAILAERDRCIKIMRQYLQFDSQRAVGWYEVEDAIKEIRRNP